MTVADDLKSSEQIQLYICFDVRDNYSQFKFQTTKFYYVGDYSRDVNNGFEGQHSRSYIRVGICN